MNLFPFFPEKGKPSKNVNTVPSTSAPLPALWYPGCALRPTPAPPRYQAPQPSATSHQPSFPSLLDNSSRNNWKQTRNKLIIPHSISLLLSVSLGKYWFLPFPISLLPFSLELILVRFSSLTAAVNHSHVSISPGIKAQSLQWPTRPYMIPAWIGLPSSLPLSSHCSMERPGQLFCSSDQGERTWRIYVDHRTPSSWLPTGPRNPTALPPCTRGSLEKSKMRAGRYLVGQAFQPKNDEILKKKKKQKTNCLH